MGSLTGIPGLSTPLSVSPSSSASSGPSSSGATGNLVLNFGGINLGNQSIPLTATSEDPATVGNTPSMAAAANLSNYTPAFIVAALAAIAYALRKHL